MCGIAGFYSFNNEIDTSGYYQAHLLLKHRGPDDEGFVALKQKQLTAYKCNDTIPELVSFPDVRTISTAKLLFSHRRLSIIDLSAGGHQPFLDEKEGRTLVFNGEIFNYIELRQELLKKGHRFHTESDTEVVFNAIKEWGENAFNLFNGMWAVAHFSLADESIILSRDRFGIKPLYYYCDNQLVCFASEIRFIRSFLNKQWQLNHTSVKQYLEKSLIDHHEDSLWKGIKEVPPGHSIMFSRSGKIKHQYWTFRPADSRINDNEAREKFRFLFEDSLKLRMRSDVEVGTLLSGGLDSTTIVFGLNRLGFLKSGNFKTFSADFEEKEFSERKFIQLTLEKLPVKPFFVIPSPGELLRELPRLLACQEEPFRSLSIYSQFKLYEKIKSASNVKVVLNGQGGDELFGGYSYHYYALFASLLKKLSFKKFSHEIGLFRKNRGVRWGRTLNMTFRQLVKNLFSPSLFNGVLFKELRFSALREYLRYDDRNSMAFGIEARVPFLDYRLVEFAFNLDESYKIRDFTNKRIVRQYAQGMVPDPIIQRTDKTGFVSPQELWQRTILKEKFDSAFSKMSSGTYMPFINPGVAKSLYGNYLLEKHDDWAKIWRYFCFAEWCKATQSDA